MVIVSALTAWHNTKADESLPSSTPDFPSIVRAHSDQLAKIDSDKGAINLFVSTIGPALQLGDAARTLGSNPLPAKLANELLVPNLAAAAPYFQPGQFEATFVTGLEMLLEGIRRAREAGG